MKSVVNFIKKPSLRLPYLIAGWPGMGNVALNAVNHLQLQLKAELFAEIEPADFFHVPGIFIKDSVIAPLSFPESKFYYWQNKASEHDIIIFMGSNQPTPGREMALANQIFLALQPFQLYRIVTFAAMPTAIDHHQEPKVWGTATNSELLGEMKFYCENLMRQGHISGMNGFILGMTQRWRVGGYCFLGEIPHYTTQIENPRSSKAVLQAALSLLKIDIDMTELDHLADYMEGQIDRYLRQLKAEAKSDEDVVNKDKGPGYVH